MSSQGRQEEYHSTVEAQRECKAGAGAGAGAGIGIGRQPRGEGSLDPFQAISGAYHRSKLEVYSDPPRQSLIQECASLHYMEYQPSFIYLPPGRADKLRPRGRKIGGNLGLEAPAVGFRFRISMPRRAPMTFSPQGAICAINKSSRSRAPGPFRNNPRPLPPPSPLLSRPTSSPALSAVMPGPLSLSLSLALALVGLAEKYIDESTQWTPDWGEAWDERDDP